MPRFELADLEMPRPLDTRGGIRARSRRGAFGKNWWARRWTETLESFDIGARLGRGRSYARRGQVLLVEVEEGEVSASVQGSRRRPYDVRIGVRRLDEADWEKLTAALLEEPVFVAQLLAGRMPAGIEELFEGIGLSLFPDSSSDLETECTCPDWSNPCKHIAAVYLLLGEEFDRDPFLVFRLRGMGRERLVGLFDERSADESAVPGAMWGSLRAQTGDSSSAEPLPIDPEEFWGTYGDGSDIHGPASAPAVSAALPKRLGGFPFWRGERDFMSAMEEIYGAATEEGVKAFAPDSSFQRRRESRGGAGP